MLKWIPTRGIAVAALAAALAAGIGQFDAVLSVTPDARAAGWVDPPGASTPAPAATATPATPITGPDFSGIVERYGPAVVNVSVESNLKPTSDDRPDEEAQPPDMPRRFGAPRQRGDRPMFGLGSGFIVDPNGVILTNAHVVAGASHVTVRLADQREFTAKVVGIDRPTDVAVLKIEARNLPVVVVGDVRRVHVGEWVLAIGSPYGFDSTATAGIVSATARSLPNQAYVPFIQTDAPVNPGNSGGPLFNARGEVIGINSQIYTDTGGFQGLSFAVPIDVAMKIGKQLLAGNEIKRGWLGAGVQDVTQPLADAFGLPKPGGALVTNVDKDGPGAKGGLQVGDVILKVDGVPVGRFFDLPPRIADIAPGARSTMEVWRRGETRQLTVVIGELKSTEAVASTKPAEGQGRLGLAVRPLSPLEAQSISENGGLLVESVSGPAERAGVRPGDVVLAINGEPVTNADKLRTLAAQSRNHAALLIHRDGARLFVPLDLG